MLNGHRIRIDRFGDSHLPSNNPKSGHWDVVLNPFRRDLARQVL